jgi:uncharacterized Zn finger protein
MEESIELETKPNRVVTYSVGGGFKRKEAQVEEMKDVWKFLTELFWRGDR